MRCPRSSHLNRLARAAIPAKAGPRPGPETLCSTPTRYPFKLQTATGWALTELPVPVFCGRASGADAPNDFCSFTSYFLRELKRAGGGWRALARAPGGRIPRGCDRWRARPIKAPESCRAQPRPEALKCHCVGSVTRTGIGLLSAPVRLPGSRSPGSNQFLLSAATKRSGSKTVWLLSMK